jgi:glycosidase
MSFKFSKIRYNFHVSKITRIKYDFDKSLFSINGDLIIADFHQARILSEKINKVRKLEGITNTIVTSGNLNALGLLHEIFHYLIRVYEEKENPRVLDRSVKYLLSHMEEKEINKVMLEYINEFPPLEVFKGKVTPEDYLLDVTDNKPNKEIILEELIILQLENSNPATISLEELYSDKTISKKSKYIDALDITEQFFITEKPIGPENLPLIQFLRKPIVASPYNIEGQLDYILDKWGVYIYDKFHDRILKSKDLIKEDLKLFLQFGGGKGTPPVPVYKYDAEYLARIKNKLNMGEDLSEDERSYYYSEIEQFTADTEWMPSVVMIAKNAFVWLDQLSKKYQRAIKRLDQVPDEELDNLARWNFTALWLIGIWERSSASRKIKHYTGNPDAVASAYSLYDYVIAHDLGGEDAFQNLKSRAWQRGIRIASDMVPNHTGIYSKWVVEKPHYFIQTNYPPYPGYTFYGSNLSDDQRVEIRIEDKYYSREDAAVVFQRRDSYSGDVKYIYHGNDGTHMPWNDTAQLNLLNPEVRESLIQTIMHVARKTPIIRFDAAMTLAKKHYQRLWFPQPGSGGDIPSRSDYSMTQAAFDEAMPVEFWREVVDRINKEMPNTLLLAEAFWLMEGYFVRTLGMHRVYNSAYMHMLMKEENNKYRELIKNTLEFNPEILKRYVNFMSNPDEETAVNQFGKGDKYFGIAMLMVTLPGLPMFAHGQVEGFSEKYGMEYKRAYYDEFIDDNLVKRHEFEIFPLMQKRYLFSQVHSFELYDFLDNFGNVNENVFAFSNKNDGEKAFIIYNNSYYECSGTINYSVNKINNGHMYSKKLAEALNIKYDHKFFYSYRDHKTKLEYLINGKDLHDFGIYVALKGYEYKVFLNFNEIYDTNGDYERLKRLLGDSGVPSIEQSFIELNLAPLHNSFRGFIELAAVEEFKKYCFPVNSKKEREEIPEKINNEFHNFLTHIENFKHQQIDKEGILKGFKSDMNSCKNLSSVIEAEKKKTSIKWFEDALSKTVLYDGKKSKENRELLFPIMVLNNTIANLKDLNGTFDELRLQKPLDEVLLSLNHNPENIYEQTSLVKLFSLERNKFLSIHNNSKATKEKTPDSKEAKFISNLFTGYSANFLNVNEFEGTKYFSKERMEQLLRWVFTLNNLDYLKNIKTTVRRKADADAKTETSIITSFKKEFKKSFEFFEKIKIASDRSCYKVDVFLNIINNEIQKESGSKTKKSPAKSSSKSKKKQN